MCMSIRTQARTRACTHSTSAVPLTDECAQGDSPCVDGTHTMHTRTRMRTEALAVHASDTLWHLAHGCRACACAAQLLNDCCAH